MEGPVVAMGAPYIYRSGAGALEVSVNLDGPNALFVTAQLTVAQRLLSSGMQHACACVTDCILHYIKSCIADGMVKMDPCPSFLSSQNVLSAQMVGRW